MLKRARARAEGRGGEDGMERESADTNVSIVDRGLQRRGFVIRIVFTRAFLLHNSCLAVCVLPIMAAVITVSKGSLMSIAAPRDKCVMFVGVQGRGVEVRLLREAVARRPWPDFSYDYDFIFFRLAELASY